MPLSYLLADLLSCCIALTLNFAVAACIILRFALVMVMVVTAHQLAFGLSLSLSGRGGSAMSEHNGFIGIVVSKSPQLLEASVFVWFTSTRLQALNGAK